MFDLALTVPALVFFLPLLTFSALLVRLKLGSPVFFRQQRPGRDAKPFLLLKFRSMSDELDAAGNLLPDAERLPRFGKFLRASSLDELPELINVVKGEMSLVGPRPLLMEYLDKYNPRQARRHEVRPGITGWAQVNGRNCVAWSDRFEMDVWYVEHCTFMLDCQILWLTVMTVLRRDGISAEGSATMPKFEGHTQ